MFKLPYHKTLKYLSSAGPSSPTTDPFPFAASSPFNDPPPLSFTCSSGFRSPSPESRADCFSNRGFLVGGVAWPASSAAVVVFRDGVSSGVDDSGCFLIKGGLKGLKTMAVCVGYVVFWECWWWSSADAVARYPTRWGVRDHVFFILPVQGCVSAGILLQCTE